MCCFEFLYIFTLESETICGAVSLLQVNFYAIIIVALIISSMLQDCSLSVRFFIVELHYVIYIKSS